MSKITRAGCPCCVRVVTQLRVAHDHANCRSCDNAADRGEFTTPGAASECLAILAVAAAAADGRAES
jgi:hypothetical protein